MISQVSVRVKQEVVANVLDVATLSIHICISSCKSFNRYSQLRLRHLGAFLVCIYVHR